MTPERFRILKHGTAALFAVVMVTLFVLGVDGLITGMQRIARIFASSQPPPAAEAPAPAPTPGVVPAFVVPPEGAGDGPPAGAPRPPPPSP